VKVKSCGSENGRFTIHSARQGTGIVDDLVDGIDGFSFAAAAAYIENTRDELVVHIVGICGKLAFPAGDESRNANTFATVTTQNGAKSFRYNRRCHENYSLGQTADQVEAREYLKSAQVVQSRISGKGG
jgi:hypothetical protein